MNPSHQVNVIYGGTFDPFHLGHEALANAILQHTEIVELRLVPCAVPALKTGASASGKDRLNMLNAWRAKQQQASKIVVDPIELQRDQTSYSIDTVLALKQQKPDCHWVFAMGADAWNSLKHWHRYSELIRLVDFWVFSREGERLVETNTDIPERETLDALLQSTAGTVFIDHQVQVPVASRELRQHSENLAQHTPEAVSAYILEHGLYSTTAGSLN